MLASTPGTGLACRRTVPRLQPASQPAGEPDEWQGVCKGGQEFEQIAPGDEAALPSSGLTGSTWTANLISTTELVSTNDSPEPLLRNQALPLVRRFQK